MVQLEKYNTPEFNHILTNIISKSNLMLSGSISPEQVTHAIQEAAKDPDKFSPDATYHIYRFCEIVEFLTASQMKSNGVFDIKKAPPSVYISLLEALQSSAKVITESDKRFSIQEKIANAREKIANKAINEVAKQIAGELPELWGDLVVDGAVTIKSSFNADTLENLIEEVDQLRKEERRSATRQ